MNLADKTTNDSTNNNEKNSGKKIISSIAGGLVGFFKKHLIIALALLALIIIIIVSLLDYETKKRNAKEDPSDPKNGPAAASEFTNNVYIDEEGKLRTEKSITELWQELKEKGMNLMSLRFLRKALQVNWLNY